MLTAKRQLAWREVMNGCFLRDCEILWHFARDSFVFQSIKTRWVTWQNFVAAAVRIIRAKSKFCPHPAYGMSRITVIGAFITHLTTKASFNAGSKLLRLHANRRSTWIILMRIMSGVKSSKDLRQIGAWRIAWRIASIIVYCMRMTRRIAGPRFDRSPGNRPERPLGWRRHARRWRQQLDFSTKSRRSFLNLATEAVLQGDRGICLPGVHWRQGTNVPQASRRLSRDEPTKVSWNVLVTVIFSPHKSRPRDATQYSSCSQRTLSCCIVCESCHVTAAIGVRRFWNTERSQRHRSAADSTRRVTLSCAAQLPSFAPMSQKLMSVYTMEGMINGSELEIRL